MKLNSDIIVDLGLTAHAIERMGVRRLSEEEIASTILYGRSVYTRGADIYVVGRREVRMHARHGVDIAPLYGIHVVCASDTGSVITAYRNKSLRGLRPKRRGRQWGPATN